MYRIWLYGLDKWGVDAADSYFLAFFERFEDEDIAANPLQYPAVDDIREGYRRSLCGRDSIYYRIASDTVEIMAIIGRQDVDSYLLSRQ